MKKILSVLVLCLILTLLTGCFSGYRDVPSDVGKTDYSVDKYRTTMQFYDDFKILQLTDFHLGIESNMSLQLDVIKDAIKESSPDLIILTGDNFMYASKGVVKSLFSFLNNECKALTEKRGGRLTKFAVTFGNHDNQGDYPRYFINDVIKSYATVDGQEISDSKYAAFVDYEDDNLFGMTNYYIDLVDDRTKSSDNVDVKYRIHIIDSNTYHYMGLDYDYDVIHPEQLEHTKEIFQYATKDKDYIGLAFFHIPFYEYQQAWEQYLDAENPSLVGQGEYREHVLYGYEKNDTYKKLREANILAFFCGHDHINYGDFIYNAQSNNIEDKAIFSYGVKVTNLLYHDTDMIGYKIITLKDNMTKEEFIDIENITNNFKNMTGGYKHYED